MAVMQLKWRASNHQWLTELLTGCVLYSREALHCRLSTLGNRNGLLASVLYLVVISWRFLEINLVYGLWALAHSVLYAGCWSKCSADKLRTTNRSTQKKETLMYCIILYWFLWCPAMSSIVLWLESFPDSNEWCGNPAKYMTSNETTKTLFLQFLKQFYKALFFQYLCLHLYSACGL